MPFAYAHLGGVDLGVVRLVGPGLGNMLLPWARSIVAARRHGWTPVFPTWPQLKVGSVLRGERDLRFYTDLFRRPPGYIGGPAKLALLLRAPRVPESEDPRFVPGNALVVFRGMDGLFEPILDAADLVRNELLMLARPRHARAWNPGGPPAIGMHVRLGDFSAPSGPDAGGQDLWSRRLPLAWYIDVLSRLRQALGNVPARVFSDGHDRELAPLLALPETTRADFGSSLADLLALASSRILIASASTFSMWAAYLGRMPVVWHRGLPPHPLFPQRSSRECSLAEGEELSGEFLAAARTLLS